MKDRQVSIGGPAVEQIPITAFSRFPRGISAEDAWKLCGPSAQMNLARLPLWKVIAAAYLEGVSHGAAIQQDIRTTPNRAKGGEARAKNLSPEARREIAQRAANARWAKNLK